MALQARRVCTRCAGPAGPRAGGRGIMTALGCRAFPMTELIPVLLSGGSGTRLWPLSRETHPKQFQPLVGEHSLLQATWLRLAGLPDAGAPIVVANEEHRFM